MKVKRAVEAVWVAGMDRTLQAPAALVKLISQSILRAGLNRPSCAISGSGAADESSNSAAVFVTSVCDCVAETHMQVRGLRTIALGAAGNLSAELDGHKVVWAGAECLDGLAQGGDGGGRERPKHKALWAPPDGLLATGKGGKEAAAVIDGLAGVGAGGGGVLRDGHEQKVIQAP